MISETLCIPFLAQYIYIYYIPLNVAPGCIDLVSENLLIQIFKKKSDSAFFKVTGQGNKHRPIRELFQPRMFLASLAND